MNLQLNPEDGTILSTANQVGQTQNAAVPITDYTKAQLELAEKMSTTSSTHSPGDSDSVMLRFTFEDDSQIDFELGGTSF